jgi:hypothetical protein
MAQNIFSDLFRPKPHEITGKGGTTKMQDFPPRLGVFPYQLGIKLELLGDF